MYDILFDRLSLKALANTRDMIQKCERRILETASSLDKRKDMVCIHGMHMDIEAHH
jgi:hypothetical protein